MAWPPNTSKKYEELPRYPSLSKLPSHQGIRRLFRQRIVRAVGLFVVLLIFMFCIGSSAPVASRSPPQRRSQMFMSSASEEPSVTWNAASGNAKSAVGKIHALFGESNPTYERALELHMAHAANHGHPMFVLRERLLSGLWSKPAWILNVILQELAKPEGERLEWILWIDADIVVMNPLIPLDVFIPPPEEFGYVNMLVTNDRHGLNNGCFLLRVSPWSVKLLTGIISFHHFRPEVKLKYTEQSAMEEMVEDRYWRRSVVHVPQYWFNSYPSAGGEIRTSDNPRPNEFRPGGLQIHFAGNRDGKRSDRMNNWMEVAEQSLPKWSVPIEQSTLKDDIAAFWKHILDERIKKGIVKVEEEKDETPVTDERSQQSDDPTPSPAATDK